MQAQARQEVNYGWPRIMQDGFRRYMGLPATASQNATSQVFVPMQQAQQLSTATRQMFQEQTGTVYQFGQQPSQELQDHALPISPNLREELQDSTCSQRRTTIVSGKWRQKIKRYTASMPSFALDAQPTELTHTKAIAPSALDDKNTGTGSARSEEYSPSPSNAANLYTTETEASRVSSNNDLVTDASQRQNGLTYQPVQSSNEQLNSQQPLNIAQRQRHITKDDSTGSIQPQELSKEKPKGVETQSHVQSNVGEGGFFRKRVVIPISKTCPKLFRRKTQKLHRAPNEEASLMSGMLFAGWESSPQSHSGHTDQQTLRCIDPESLCSNCDHGSSIPNAVFEYPLLQELTQIRLLRIKPGKLGDPLVCELYPITMDSDPEYESLSYAWGDKTITVEIECQKSRMNIAHSLHDALQRIRDRHEDRVVWADAICINQNDDKEKGHQVRMMRSIYKRAKKVLVWLGPDELQQALPVFAVAVRVAQKDFSTVPQPGDQLWESFAALFGRTWFWRLWCLQEIALAASAEVMWGAAKVSWEHLGFTAAWIRTTSYQVMRCHPMEGVFNACLMYSMSGSNIYPEPVTFLHLMSLTRQFQASDTRDRIYSLLGLPTTDANPDEGDLFVEPDYTITTSELYELFARKVLETSQTLRILSAVQHGPEVEQTMPSWIPQWDRLFTHALAPAEYILLKNHSASIGLPTSQLRLEESILFAEGIEFDSIVSISDTFPDSTAFSTELWRIERLWRTMVFPLRKYPSGTDLSTAFCWTITAAKDWYGMLIEDKDTESHLEDFAAFQRQHFSQPVTEGPGDRGDVDRFAEAVSNACIWRRLFVTQKGYIGIGPPCLREGDVVCVLANAIVPFVLRQNGPYHKLVGEAYVHGIMNGEACRRPLWQRVEVRPFWLS
ncbi:uncharacterized protein K452DRAFT_154350 [Aplosporella prunicola CBS 121167]|uniref:Heterokaryon incompatibility domain-containing protein n=1 Tax=Aplosporella prunicola CBS 121167 TaxID=1176127 RepID=A0A6A6BKJ7_9PEZI|nr:uncharacterized protein K452DRAFT_154350 [Aplosporella prunicola CBS 121167]KAF2144178.1 hypothetical protein K452DRAFT_154350 [Aplosporella prunicola CBS 121167]